MRGRETLLTLLFGHVPPDCAARDRSQNGVVPNDVADDGAGCRAFEAALSVGVGERQSKRCGEKGDLDVFHGGFPRRCQVRQLYGRVNGMQMAPLAAQLLKRAGVKFDRVIAFQQSLIKGVEGCVVDPLERSRGQETMFAAN